MSEAYDLCVTKVVRDITESHGVDRDQVVAVPMTEAETVERGDGYFWVWANVTSQLGEPEVRDTGAAYCIVGGTVENPEFAVAGSALRDLRDEFDPHVDFTLFSD